MGTALHLWSLANAGSTVTRDLWFLAKGLAVIAAAGALAGAYFGINALCIRSRSKHSAGAPEREQCDLSESDKDAFDVIVGGWKQTAEPREKR